MYSDDWLRAGYRFESRIKVFGQVYYRHVFDSEENVAGVIVDYEFGDDFHYDLLEKDWRSFCDRYLSGDDENYEQKLLELDKLSREAWQDWQGYQIQVRQMEEKVEADSIAYELTRRQFEEGLSTAIDLRNTSAQLLNSRATLLQCRLMAVVKEHLVRYYRGETIWE